MRLHAVDTERGRIWLNVIHPSPEGPGFVKDEGKIRLFLASFHTHRQGRPIQSKRQRGRPKLWGIFESPAELWAAWLNQPAALIDSEGQ